MPIIIGAPRSGTTLLRLMLDSHPDLAIPPETGFLPAVRRARMIGCRTRKRFFRFVTNFPADAPAWPDFSLDKNQFWAELTKIEPFHLPEAVRTFYRLYAQTQHKPRYGDKTPGYCKHLRAIARLLPEAHFIHLIRDGRDTALSLRGLWFAPGKDITTLALHWKEHVRKARAAGPLCPAYIEVRYEELVRNPQPVLQQICNFVGLNFHPMLLRYWERTPERLREHRTRYKNNGHLQVTHEQRRMQQELTMQPLQPSRAFRWKSEMSLADQNIFMRVAGDTLRELGYSLSI